MLDNDGLAVGGLLLLYSSRIDANEAAIHCNLSSWYVEPAFRNYAPLLTKIAQRNKEVTYLNISPATWTWPIIETQGFNSYCSGLLFSIPALSRVASGMAVEIISPDTRTIEGLPQTDVELLTDTRDMDASVWYAARLAETRFHSSCRRCASGADGLRHRRCNWSIAAISPNMSDVLAPSSDC